MAPVIRRGKHLHLHYLYMTPYARSHRQIEQHAPSVKKTAKSANQLPADSGQALNDAYDKAFGDEPVQDMTKLIRHKPRRHRLAIVLSVLGVCVLAAVAGFIYFTAQVSRFSGNLVELEIVSADSLASGGEVALTIKIDNAESVTLNQSQLAVTYPDGFTFVSASQAPTNEANNAFSLGDLKPGAGRRVEIRGTIVGEVGSSRLFRATLSYRPANFNSEFTTEADRTVNLTSSIIGFVLDGPQRAIPGTELTYRLGYENTSREKLDQIRVELAPPDQFTVTAVDPAADAGTIWVMRNLEPDQSGTITVRGRFDGTVGDLKELKAAIGLVDSASLFQLQTEKSLIVQLVKPELSIQMLVNDSESDQTLAFGSQLKYVLRYTNSTDEVLKNVQISASITGNAIDWSSLDDASGGVRSDSTVTWTKDQIPALAELKTGASGEIAFTANLLDGAASGQPNQRYQAVSQASIEAGSDDLGEAKVTGETRRLTVKVQSQLTLTTTARYYSEDFTQLGAGPLPPQVGQTTSFRLNWAASNSVNDIAALTIQTTIPKTVYWTGRYVSASVGEMRFDPTDRSLTWTISRLAAGQTATARFELSITPAADQVGELVVLTDATAAEGSDDFTQSQLKANQAALTSNLENDAYGQGKGAVVPAAGTSNANVNGA